MGGVIIVSHSYKLDAPLVEGAVVAAVNSSVGKS